MYLFIAAQWVNGFGKIGYGVQDKIVLFVKIGTSGTAFLPCGQEEIVHESLEYETRFSRITVLPYMSNAFRCDAAFEILIAYLVPSEAFGKLMAKNRLPLFTK